MNLSGAMLITQTEIIWLQEGWLNKIDTERHEISGYLYFFTVQKININDRSEIYINEIRLHIRFVMKSIGFHPKIIKYCFIVTDSVKNLEHKIQSKFETLENKAQFQNARFINSY
jgi:hypothetical protein